MYIRQNGICIVPVVLEWLVPKILGIYRYVIRVKTVVDTGHARAATTMTEPRKWVG